jgi:hypothetical protein
VLVQNRRATKNNFYIRRGYIKADSEEEATNNLNTVFSGFDFTIADLQPTILP